MKTRKAGHIIGRALIALGVAIYVVVALLNYSVVQSYLGTAAGRYFSKEWGGEVKVSSLHANPLGHVILKNVLLVSPDNDTIIEAGRIGINFDRFPFRDNTLKARYVSLRNTSYHLETVQGSDSSKHINLQYIIDYFAAPEKEEYTTPSKPFTIDVKQLQLYNVRYRMDLAQSHNRPAPPHGVEIPHMDYRSIHAKIKNVKVTGSNVDCRIVKFHAEERSGFVLQDLSADISVGPDHIRAQNMELQTDASRLLLDAELTYPGSWQMDPFLDSVTITTTFKPGTIASMADAAYWAPTLWGMDETFQIEGYVSGPVADMEIEDFSALFGNESEVRLYGHVKGLPKIASTRFDVEVGRLHTTYEDLAAVRHPEGYTFKAEKIMKALGAIDIAAALHGTATDCSMRADVDSHIGRLLADAKVEQRPGRRMRFSADVESPMLDLTALTPNKWVTRTGIDLSVTGEGRNMDELSADLRARLSNTRFQGHTLRPATLDMAVSQKTLALDLALDDPLAEIALSGSADLSDSVPRLSIDLSIPHCSLSGLGLIPDTSTHLELSTQASLDGQGSNLDNLNGSILFHKADITLNGTPVSLGQMSLDAQAQDYSKKVRFLSDWCRLDLQGYFDYADLGCIYHQFYNQYIPMHPETQPLSDSQKEALADDALDFDLVWNDSRGMLASFAPKIKLADGTTLHGNYNYTESVKLVMRSDSLLLGPLEMHDVGLSSGAAGDRYQVKLDVEQYRISGLTLFEDARLSASSTRSEASLGLKWGRSSQDPDRGDVAFSILCDSSAAHMLVIKPLFYVDSNRWTFICPGGVDYDHGTINTDKFSIEGSDRSIDLCAHVNGQEYDYVDANIRNLNIGRLIRVLAGKIPLSLDGTLDGSCTLYNVTQDPHLNANLQIGECNMNGYQIGDLEARASWLAGSRRMALELASFLEADTGYTSPISAEGYLDMEDVTSMDFSIALNRFGLNTLTPLLSSFASNVGGSLSGKVGVSGPLDKPIINGRLDIDSGQLTVNATDVAYTFSNPLLIEDSRVKMKHFLIRDILDDSLSVDGEINLTDFSDISLDLAISTPKILLLDNAHSSASDYFGTLLASVDGTIEGTLKSLNLNLDAQTLPGSTITIPIDDKRQVQNLDYITFVGDPSLNQSSDNRSRMPSAYQSPLNLVLNARITPDVHLQLPISLNQMMINIGASGSGDLRLALSQGQTPSVKGEYEIISGNMVFTLLSLVKKTFAIEEGSLLEFPGPVADARFDLKAIYSHRTNLSTLTGSLGGESSQKNILVESIIALSGSIQDPHIDFDLRLPNADQSVNEEVFAYIDRNNERDMLNQTMSLLILGQFYNASASESSASTANGYNMVANTLGSAVSSLVKFVNVNFDYKAATDLTTEQFDVDISKEWNKFYFESTFGYGGEAHDISNIEGNRNLVGDMLLGYKVSPRVHLFAFNRTNTNDYTRSDLPFKQGLGLKFTHDFENWSDLFHKWR